MPCLHSMCPRWSRDLYNEVGEVANSISPFDYGKLASIGESKPHAPWVSDTRNLWKPEWLPPRYGPTPRDASFVLTSILGSHFGVIGCSHSEEGGCIGAGLDS